MVWRERHGPDSASVPENVFRWFRFRFRLDSWKQVVLMVLSVSLSLSLYVSLSLSLSLISLYYPPLSLYLYSPCLFPLSIQDFFYSSAFISSKVSSAGFQVRLGSWTSWKNVILEAIRWGGGLPAKGWPLNPLAGFTQLLVKKVCALFQPLLVAHDYLVQFQRGLKPGGGLFAFKNGRFASNSAEEDRFVFKKFFLETPFKLDRVSVFHSKQILTPLAAHTPQIWRVKTLPSSHLILGGRSSKVLQSKCVLTVHRPNVGGKPRPQILRVWALSVRDCDPLFQLRVGDRAETANSLVILRACYRAQNPRNPEKKKKKTAQDSPPRFGSMANMIGGPGYRTMEMNGGSSAPHPACTPCVPLFCTSFSRGGSRSDWSSKIQKRYPQIRKLPRNCRFCISSGQPKVGFYIFPFDFQSLRGSEVLGSVTGPQDHKSSRKNGWRNDRRPLAGHDPKVAEKWPGKKNCQKSFKTLTLKPRNLVKIGHLCKAQRWIY